MRSPPFAAAHHGGRFRISGKPRLRGCLFFAGWFAAAGGIRFVAPPETDWRAFLGRAGLLQQFFVHAVQKAGHLVFGSTCPGCLPTFLKSVKMETPKTTLPRLPITVCMIAGAEARRLRRALASVAGWTSEIVVVLNEEVSDGTDKIAEEFG